MNKFEIRQLKTRAFAEILQDTATRKGCSSLDYRFMQTLQNLAEKQQISTEVFYLLDTEFVNYKNFVANALASSPSCYFKNIQTIASQDGEQSDKLMQELLDTWTAGENV